MVDLALRTADVIEFASRAIRRLVRLATDRLTPRRHLFDPRQLPRPAIAQYLAVIHRLVKSNARRSSSSVAT
jgi:hypothetical protein